MDIKRLPQDVRSYLRSGANINTISACVTELVLNSLDAKSTAVAIRVNLVSFRVQVVDNGNGITMRNMSPIGIRYMTSKCGSLNDLKKLKRFGFRGEALASILAMCDRMTIISRPAAVENTYQKIYAKGKWCPVENIKQRSTQGTTITVEGFLHNFPVRQNRVNTNLDMHEIKQCVEELAIIHPHVSFNLRNDANGKIVFQSNKRRTVLQSIVTIFPDIIEEDVLEIKITKGNISVSGLIYNCFSHNKLQLIYLNKRPIVSQKIKNVMLLLLKKRLAVPKLVQMVDFTSHIEKPEHPLFIINITCPYSEVDLISKNTVEFKQWDIILNSIEKVVVKLFCDKNLSPKEKLQHLETITEQKNESMGVSQIKGALKSITVRRQANQKEIPFKQQKLNEKYSKKTQKCELPLNKCDQKSKERKTNSVLENKMKEETEKSLSAEQKKITKVPENYLSITQENSSINIQKLYQIPDLPQPIINNDLNNLKDDGGKSKILSSINKVDFDTRINHEKWSKPKPVKRRDCNNKIEAENNYDCGKKSKLYSPFFTDKLKKPQFDKLISKKQGEMNNKISTELKDYAKEACISPFFINKLKNPKNNKLIPNVQQNENIFDKHLNTQSLVLNSDLNQTTDTINNQEKGKQLIMEMFLKSTFIFPNEEQKINDTIKLLVETTKQNVVAASKIHNATTTMSMKITSKKTIMSNSLYALCNSNKTIVKSVKNAFCPALENTTNYKRIDMTSKCIQTTMIEQQNYFNADFQYFPQQEYSAFNYDYGISRENTNHNITLSKYFKTLDFKKKNHTRKSIPIFETRYNKLYNDSNYANCGKKQNYGVFQDYDFQNFRTPITVSIPNYNFSNFDLFDEPYKQFKQNSNGYQRYRDKLQTMPMFRCYNPSKYYKHDLLNCRPQKYRNYDWMHDCNHPRFVTESRPFTQRKYTENAIPRNYKERCFPSEHLNVRKFPKRYLSKRHKSDREKETFNFLQNNEKTSKKYTGKTKFDYGQNNCLLCKKLKPSMTRYFTEPTQKLPMSHFFDKRNTSPIFQKSHTEPFYFGRKSPAPCNEDSFTIPSEMFNYNWNPNSAERIPSGINSFDWANRNVNDSLNLISNVRRIDKNHDFKFSYGNFDPVISSTQCNNEENSLEFIKQKNQAQTSDFSSDVIEGTPLNISQNNRHVISPNSKSDHSNSVSIKNKVNSSHSVLNISIDTFKKFNLLKPSSECGQINKERSVEATTIIESNLLNKPQERNSFEKFNNTGNGFYLHKRTGMTFLNTPKPNLSYNMTRRFGFVPKGLSPILLESKPVDVSLSPTMKKSLHVAIIKSYQDELKTVKWLNYIHNYEDVNKFFEELYREKTKQFNNCIPIGDLNALPRSMIKSCPTMQVQPFTKAIFKELNIIGQLDKKFIVAVRQQGKQLIILFDQHAVDERIRLEKLLDAYMEKLDYQDAVRFNSSKCEKNIIVKVTLSDYNILIDFKELFNNLGLNYEQYEEFIEITHIPTCIYNKYVKNNKPDRDLSLEKVIMSLVHEEISVIISTRGIGTKMPKVFQTIINSEACRGAVKFGDQLSLNECQELINNLSNCRLPFQCAHGRPTLTPIINLSENFESVKTKPNLKKLLSK